MATRSYSTMVKCSAKRNKVSIQYRYPYIHISHTNDQNSWKPGKASIIDECVIGNIVYTHKWILFTPREEGKHIIHRKMNGPENYINKLTSFTQASNEWPLL